MDYKEKYELALERARKIHNDTEFDYEKGMMEEVFPELAETEGERIGKQLLNWFKGCHWDSIDDGTLKRDDIIAWLEKYGEHPNIS